MGITMKAPLIAAAALALSAGTVMATPQVFPTDTGSAIFASGSRLDFTKTGTTVTYAATGFNGTATTGATVYADAYNCDELTGATTLATIADVKTAVTFTQAGDFRELAGLAVKVGAECALIIPQEKAGGTKFYGGVLRSYGSGEASVNGILFPVISDEAGTATGQINFQISEGAGDINNPPTVQGTIMVKDGLLLNEKYMVKLSTTGCNQLAPAQMQDYTGTPHGIAGLPAFSYSFAEVGEDDKAPNYLNSGGFKQLVNPDDDGTFSMVGMKTTPEEVSNLVVRLHHWNTTKGHGDDVIMCGYVSYLPKIRGYIAGYANADNNLVVVGKATGLQKVEGIKGTMHMHAARSDPDVQVDFPRCEDASTVGGHVKVENVKDEGSVHDHFISGSVGTGVSLLTYSPNNQGVAPIDGLVSGYWTLEDIKYQAIVMHTRQAGLALDLELRAGCSNMGGVDPTELDQTDPDSDAASATALSASALLVAVLVNALL